MNEITVERAAMDGAELRETRPDAGGFAELAEDTIVRAPDGQPLVAYLRLWWPGDAQLEALRAGLLRLHFVPSTRVRGLVVRSLSFGYLPRNQTRTDFCRPAVVARDHPALARALADIALELEDRYRQLAPDIFAFHAEEAAKVGPGWRLPGAACFTGGTINRDNAIAYHQDRGNFAATYSAMPVVRAGMDGGVLVIPELGMWLPVADGTVTYFDGQSLWHGVTPLRKIDRAAHRFSLVYYSLTQLWHCLPPAAEVERHQIKRTELEERRRRDPRLPLVPKARADVEALEAARAGGAGA